MFNWILTAYGKAETTVRKTLAAFIRSKMPEPKPMTRKVLTDYSRMSSCAMLAHAHEKGQVYLERAQALGLLDDGKTTEQYWKTRTRLIIRYQNALEMRPHTDKHLEMLNKVLGLINETHVNNADHKSVSEFCDSFRLAVADYVQECEQWFHEANFQDESDYLARESENRYVWWYGDGDNPSYITPRGEKNIQQEHKDMVESIISAMVHNQVPDEVVLFMLVPSLSSAGYAYFEDEIEGIYTLVNFMPYHWFGNHRDSIWETRMRNKFVDEEDFYDPADIDTTFLEKLETDELNETEGIWTDEDDSKGSTGSGKKRPPMDESHTPKPKKTKGKGKGKPDPEGEDKPADDDPPKRDSDTGDTQPKIPDDTSYIPDPILARMARDITSYFQGLDKMDMVHDHMTRFGTTTEQPQTLSSWMVRKTDSRVFSGPSITSRKYVVTYTRKGRKPIFNPVD